jgi:hypothetical protein
MRASTWGGEGGPGRSKAALFGGRAVARVRRRARPDRGVGAVHRPSGPAAVRPPTAASRMAASRRPPDGAGAPAPAPPPGGSSPGAPSAAAGPCRIWTAAPAGPLRKRGRGTGRCSARSTWRHSSPARPRPRGRGRPPGRAAPAVKRAAKRRGVGGGGGGGGARSTARSNRSAETGLRAAGTRAAALRASAPHAGVPVLACSCSPARAREMWASQAAWRRRYRLSCILWVHMSSTACGGTVWAARGVAARRRGGRLGARSWGGAAARASSPLRPPQRGGIEIRARRRAQSVPAGRPGGAAAPRRRQRRCARCRRRRRLGSPRACPPTQRHPHPIELLQAARHRALAVDGVDGVLQPCPCVLLEVLRQLGLLCARVLRCIPRQVRAGSGGQGGWARQGLCQGRGDRASHA